MGNRQIARKLDIAENTVKQHTHALYGALKVKSRTEAIAAATRLGIRPD
jgi:ATP/maltotriose-dependent transcriptional regulator MalT